MLDIFFNSNKANDGRFDSFELAAHIGHRIFKAVKALIRVGDVLREKGINIDAFERL